MDVDNLCEAADKSFGPTVPGHCRGGFDFTLLFEQAILFILPCAVFLTFCAVRVAALSTRRPVVANGASYALKLGVIVVYAALQIASLVLWNLEPALRTSVGIPFTVLFLLSVGGLGLVSHYEHSRSIHPSDLLALFLASTLLPDIAICRTLWLLALPTIQVPGVFTAGVVVKVGLLVLESLQKVPLEIAGKCPPPESLSSLYSRSFFWWVNSLLRQGFRRMVTLEDLDNLDDKLASESLRREMLLAWKIGNHKSRWCLFWALCRALKGPFLITVPPRLALIGFNYSQPFLISAAVSYVQDSAASDEHSKAIGYGLTGAAILVYLGIAVSNSLYNYKLYRAITMIRGCLVGIIYTKTLQLPSADAKGSAALTLMSSDVDRIALTAETASEIWAGLLEIGIAIYLLERQLGWACIAPLLLAAVSLAGNSTIGKLIPARLKKWQQAVQARVAATSVTLRNIRSVKMTGMAPAMAGSLQKARDYELACSAHFRWFVAFMNIFGSLPRLLSAPITFSIFVFSTQFFSEGGLSASRAFTTLSLLELLTGPLGKVLQGIPVFTATFGCLDRIQEYLLQGEQADSRTRDSSSSPSSPAIVADGVAVKYADSPSSALQDVSLRVGEGELVMVVGPVGCGKSTLLRTLVGDIAPASGTLSVMTPQVAYCQQAPWLTNATVRQVVVGQSSRRGGPESVDAVDDAWYRTVLTACGLDKDVGDWLDGDGTVVGSGGVSCSGGQKHRLALARAVYSRKSILVLDDVLSALDQQTQHLVFQSLLSETGLLRMQRATVVMVTSTTHYLSSADQIIVFDSDGRISRQGSYDDLVESGDLARLEGAATRPKETQTDTTSSLQSQGAAKPAPKPKITQATMSQKEKTRRTGDLACYSAYIRSMGWMRALIFVAIAALSAFFSRFSHVWLQWYTDRATIDRGLFIGVYFAFASGAAILGLLSFWWMMIIIIPISAGSLHQQLVTAILRAPLHFFSSVDLGVILNSQDMQFATAQLPISTMNAVSSILVCIAQFALISAGSGYLAATVPALVLAIWLLQKFYLATSRQIRLLDLEQKSPLYTSLTETVDGLATIRAFGWTLPLETIFLARLDDSQRPVYVMYCIQRWLNLVLDLIVAALAVLLVALAVLLRGNGGGGAALLGVAMVSVVGFSQSLGQFIFFYTELETSLGAIARITEYTTEIRSEDDTTHPSGEGPLPEEWPAAGCIRLEGVTAHYHPDDEPVLRNISLEIPAGKLVGISGRTGSGKSSLVLTILRLLHISTGTVTIDGVDTSTIPVDELRAHITTVPQDPYFPPARTIRQSLDDNKHKHTDAQLIAALDAVGLLPHVTAHLARDVQAEQATARILDTEMSALPLSVGQLQLFSLARALLQTQSRVVLLDEVTSAVDAATEAGLRGVLREGLRGRTVVMVAHRAEMLGMCDVVVRLGNGGVVEVVEGAGGV